MSKPLATEPRICGRCRRRVGPDAQGLEPYSNHGEHGENFGVGWALTREMTTKNTKNAKKEKVTCDALHEGQRNCAGCSGLKTQDSGLSLQRFDRVNQLRRHLLPVAVQHPRVIQHEQLILYS